MTPQEQQAALDTVTGIIATEASKHYEALTAKYEKDFADKSDTQKTAITQELLQSIQKSFDEKDASISDLSDKVMRFQGIIEGMQRNGGKEVTPSKDGEFSMDDARQIFSDMYQTNGKEMPDVFSASDIDVAKAYDEVSKNLYTNNSEKLRALANSFHVNHRSHELSNSVVNRNMTANQLAYAHKKLGNNHNFGVVGNGAYVDPYLLKSFKTCLIRPQNLLGYFGTATVPKYEYKYTPDSYDSANADFDDEKDCFATPTSDITIPKPVTRSVKSLSSMYCATQREFDELEDTGNIEKVREAMVNGIINKLNNEIMFGNGANVDNFLNAITTLDLGTPAGQLPAGSFITWQALQSAWDAVEIDDKTNAKIYATNNGRSYIGAFTDANSNPNSAVRWENGKLMVGMIEVVTINRSFHTAGYGNSVGALLAGKVNFIVGDLKQVATLITKKAPTVQRFTGANGSRCDVYVANTHVDFAINCPKAAIKIVSP